MFLSGVTEVCCVHREGLEGIGRRALSGWGLECWVLRPTNVVEFWCWQTFPFKEITNGFPTGRACLEITLSILLILPSSLWDLCFHWAHSSSNFAVLSQFLTMFLLWHQSFHLHQCFVIFLYFCYFYFLNCSFGVPWMLPPNILCLTTNHLHNLPCRQPAQIYLAKQQQKKVLKPPLHMGWSGRAGDCRSERKIAAVGRLRLFFLTFPGNKYLWLF